MKDIGEKTFRNWMPERQVKKWFEFEENSRFRYLTEANFCSLDISRSLSKWFYMHTVWDICTLQGSFKLYSLLGQNPTCLQMFETLQVLKMFAENYLLSFMPDEEYNTFLAKNSSSLSGEFNNKRDFPCCFEEAIACFKFRNHHWGIFSGTEKT